MLLTCFTSFGTRGSDLGVTPPSVLKTMRMVSMHLVRSELDIGGSDSVETLGSDGVETCLFLKENSTCFAFEGLAFVQV